MPSDAPAPLPTTPPAAPDPALRARRLRVLVSLAVLMVAGLVLVVAAVVLSSASVETDRPAPESAEVAGVEQTADLLDGVEQRGLTIGDKDAPFTLIEFIDVQCPFCRDHQLDEQPTIVRELVRTGRIKLRLAPEVVPGFSEDSEAGRAVALRLAHDGKAWDFITLFFYNQGNENTGYATSAFLRKLLAEIPGTSPADTKRTPDARDAKTITELRDLANTLRVSGTPAFALGRSGKDPGGYVLLDLVRGESAAPQIIAAVEKLERQFKR